MCLSFSRNVKVLVFMLIALVMLAGCKKDNNDDDDDNNNTTTTTVPKAESYPLTIGNYWVYQRYSVTDSTENAAGIDSAYVSGDTIINNNTFYIVMNRFFCNSTCTEYLRDSIGYIINHKGQIHFAENHFNDTLLVDSVSAAEMVIYYQMKKPDSSITVGAGTFTITDYQGTVHFQDSTYPYENPRYIHYYFAKDIGPIKFRSFYTMSPIYIEARLIRYHIE